MEHGTTLRTAMTELFYKNEADAFDKKVKLKKCIEISLHEASKTEGLDPFYKLELLVGHRGH